MLQPRRSSSSVPCRWCRRRCPVRCRPEVGGRRRGLPWGFSLYLRLRRRRRRDGLDVGTDVVLFLKSHPQTSHASPPPTTISIRSAVVSEGGVPAYDTRGTPSAFRIVNPGTAA